MQQGDLAPGRRIRVGAVSVIAAMSCWLGAGTVPAVGDPQVGTTGSGSGQTNDPVAVAVDSEAHLLFVADDGNNRVDVFDADSGEFVRAFGWGVADGATNALQVCTTTCFKGVAGSGKGQFSGMIGIAVDDDPTSPGFHDLYVFENGNHRVQKFGPAGGFVWMAGGDVNKTTGEDLCTESSGDECGIGVPGTIDGRFQEVAGAGIDVGPGGVVYVADQIGEGETRKGRLQKFDPEGAHEGTLILTVPGGSGRVSGLATAEDGTFFVGTTGATGALRKYSAAGTELYRRDLSFNLRDVALDAAGNVWVADFTGGNALLDYDPGGTQIRGLYSDAGGSIISVALYGETAYVINDSATGASVRAVVFPPPGPVVSPSPTFTNVNPIGNTKATFNARIDPEGKATTYYFEYISEEQFLAAGETFGSGTIKTPEASLAPPVDFASQEVCREENHGTPAQGTCELRPATQAVAGLSAETPYRLRAVATNADGSDRRGPVVTFETKPPIEIGPIWTEEVTLSSASLHAELNPLEIFATGRFEYVTQKQYEESEFADATVLPPLAEEPIDFGAGTGFVEGSAKAGALTPGTTYRYRFIASDHCKPSEPTVVCEFEAPTDGIFTTFIPLQERGGCSNGAFRAGSAAFLPDCRAYEMVSPVDKKGGNIEPVNNVNGFVAGLDQAALDGDSITFSSYKAFGDVAAAPYTNQYLARRGSEGWASEAISPGREGPSLMTFESPQLDRQYKAFSADLCSGWVVQDANPILALGAIEGYPGFYRREDCGAGTGSFEAITRVEEPLGPQPPNLPPTSFIPEPQGMSADGSISVFQIGENLTADAPAQPAACSSDLTKCETRVYEGRSGDLNLVCVLPTELPVTDSCAVGTPTQGGSERTASVSTAVSEDGSHIVFTTYSGLPNIGKLYVRIKAPGLNAKTVQISAANAQFWFASADGSKVFYSVSGKLFEFDVVAETSTPIAEHIFGVAGVSDDGSRAYFASSDVLTAETNSEGDGAQAGKPNLYLYEAGGDFRFIGTLTSADVLEIESGPVARIPARRLSRVTPNGSHIAFMSRASLTGYDNLDANSKQPDYEVFLYNAEADRIFCPSCNPSGARPNGRQLTQKLLESRWAAARIPTWTSQLYGQRVLTDDGTRLYFDSFESLVSTDANGQEDVYQWEQAGAGNCDEGSQTYQPASGGCLDLISSGKSKQGSELTDISADGRDVFFKTYESLLSQDPDRLDIYDARAGGGFEPQPPPPPICQGEMCLEDPAPAPVPPSPSSPAAGPGNPPVTKPKHCRKGTHKVKRKGKVRCVKNKHKKKAGKSGRTGR